VKKRYNEKMDDLKFTGTEPIDVDKAWAKLNGRIECS
jgi:hypothetical protein